jgi:hypothetical protein
MSDKQTGDPLVDTLRALLGPQPGLEIFDYSCADDFRRLWRFEALPAKRVLIVWSQTALDHELDPIDATDCLSPIDWAVCFAAQKKKDVPGEWPEVMVLDLDAELHSHIPSVAHLMSLKPDQVPWLRIEPDMQLETIRRWLATPVPRDDESCKTALHRFLREIRLNLTEVKSTGAYDRHAISNIIGPMVLRGHAAKQTIHATALLQLLRTCGLIAAPELSAALQAGPAKGGAPGPEGGGLHVLLLDDQATHGWTDWVRESLPGAKVTTSCDPTPLVQAVERQLNETGAKDLRYRLALPDIKEGAAPVLLLDLRLFSGNKGGEVAFYKDVLLPVVARFTDRTDLAWPAFSSTDKNFTAAQDAVASGTLVPESPEHHEALTWLPRVLSLADLSLPIILFSSTGRRFMENAFHGYQNIILGFEKPRFFESAAQSAQMAMATEEGLLRAIEDARTLILGRTRARMALQCHKCLVEKKVPERYGHFELFIDESGNGKKLVVGGLAAGFASLADAHEFDDRLVRAGVRYFPTLAGPVPAGAPLSKATTCQPQFEEVVNHWRAENRPLLLAFITLNGIEPFSTPLRFLDMDFMDNRWRLAVEAVVEVFLSEIVARLQQVADHGRRASVSIYGPTRVSVAASRAEADMNEARFGTLVQRLDQKPPAPPLWGNHAVAESNLFHTACELLRSHCMTIDLEKAKFVRLNYAPKQCREWEVRARDITCTLRSMHNPAGKRSDDYSAQLAQEHADFQRQLAQKHGQLDEWRAGTRSLHYVCDQILWDTVWQNAPWATIPAGIPTFHESYDKILRSNLAAARFLDTRRTVEAMVAWQPHAAPQPGWRQGVRRASESIGARLAMALDGISGAAFVQAAIRLRTIMPWSRATDMPSIPKPAANNSADAVPAALKAQAGEAAPQTTRYFVRLDNLPSAVTADGLLEAARRASGNPVGCEIADDLDEGLHVAAIYFANEAALTQVAQALRRHGWQARPFIASERQATAQSPGADGGAPVEQEPYNPRAELVNPPETGCRLRVGPVPGSLDVGKVASRVRETHPRVLSIHHMGPVRGGGKYLLEFNWPAAAPQSHQEFIACGNEQLAVEFVSTGPDEWQ